MDNQQILIAIVVLIIIILIVIGLWYMYSSTDTTTSSQPSPDQQKLYELWGEHFLNMKLYADAYLNNYSNVEEIKNKLYQTVVDIGTFFTIKYGLTLLMPALSFLYDLFIFR